jgi:hypothetical protein
MPASRNIFIDFDGTLVLENSSRVLMDTLLASPSSRPERLLAGVLTGRWRRPVRFGLAVAGRLVGERDLELILMLLAYRRTIVRDGEQIFAGVAARLTLNTDLQTVYSRPFGIASTGLRPVIEAYLVMHPELHCTAVFASNVARDTGRYAVRILPLRAKIRALDAFNSTSYFTDYDKEVKLFQRRSQGNSKVKRLKNPAGQTVFHLELKK